MKTKFHIAWLCSAAARLDFKPRPRWPWPLCPPAQRSCSKVTPAACASPRPRSNADGTFEFKGLKAGKYRLLLPLGSTTANSYLGTTVVNGAQLELQGSFVIAVTPINDTPTVSEAKLIKVGQGELSLKSVVGTDGGIWRTRNAIAIAADGGSISGSFKVTESESPVPQNRAANVPLLQNDTDVDGDRQIATGTLIPKVEIRVGAAPGTIREAQPRPCTVSLSLLRPP